MKFIFGVPTQIIFEKQLCSSGVHIACDCFYPTTPELISYSRDTWPRQPKIFTLNIRPFTEKTGLHILAWCDLAYREGYHLAVFISVYGNGLL